MTYEDPTDETYSYPLEERSTTENQFDCYCLTKQQSVKIVGFNCSVNSHFVWRCNPSVRVIRACTMVQTTAVYNKYLCHLQTALKTGYTMGCGDIVGYKIVDNDNTQSFNIFFGSGATVGYKIVDNIFLSFYSLSSTSA